jgi:hypothetical protein
MGLWEFLQQWPRGRLLSGVLASVLIHVLVTAGVLWGLRPELTPKWRTKPGDTLIVELPKPDEPASAGSPTAPPPPKAPAPPEARPTPPAPRPQAAPAPRREAPAPPREERRVAAAPRTPAPPVPRAPEPAPEPVPRATEPAAPAAPPPQAAPPEPAPHAAEPAPRPAEAGPPATRPTGERQIASVPPAGRPAPSVSDVRAALRRGAGGRAQGRGGIEGDPIPLDSTEAEFSDYLELLRRQIQAKWGHACVKNPETRVCEGHTTSLDIHFGILKDGSVQFVDVMRPAAYPIYDEYAVNAIKLASPFPPVPPVMLRAMKAGSTGIIINARFSYIVVESSLTNFLR